MKKLSQPSARFHNHRLGLWCLALFCAKAATAQAGLLGATVNVSAYYPDSNTVFQAGSNTTVSGAIEYPTGTFTEYNPSWQIDITDTRITISDLQGNGFPYGEASFNGWILTVISGPNILSAVPAAASQFDPVGVSIRNGNQLLLNYSGVQGPMSGTSIIDITTGPTPCPATITVTTAGDSGPGSLRQAILDANACPGANVIDFAPSAYGTILLTSGELLITDDLILNGPGAAMLAVDGNGSGRVFHISPGKNVTLASLTITNGLANSNHGGGIYNDHSAVTIRNCTVTGNSAIGPGGGAGGGILSDGQSGSASLQIFDSTVSGNSASGRGGGIFNFFAPLTVSNCTVSGNSAASVGYGGGGGIFSGAISSVGSASLKVIHSTLSGNSAGQGRGGGIWNDGEFGRSTAEIVNSTLSGNSAGDGGGIFNDGFVGRADLQVVNSTLSGNSAFPGSGGGIYNYGISGSATATVVNCTFSDNSAGMQGGGIYNYGGFDGTIVQIGSTILKAGASGESIYTNFGTVISRGYNLSSDDGGGFLTATGDQINTDPLLGPLQDNGGPTFTHAFLCRSPAIDRGKNFSASASDQRGAGFARTVDDPAAPSAPGGDGTDIGAFEAQQPLSDCNHPPVAVIQVSPLVSLPGVPGLVVIAANNATACVALDGSLSSDPDQDALTYRWFNEPDALPFASGVTATDCLNLGTHTIQLVVTDAHGASGTDSVTVLVISPSAAVAALIAAVDNAALEPRNTRPFIATLTAAGASFDRGDRIPGVNQLQAFQNKVRAQIAPVDPALAQQFIDTAQAIIGALGGP